MMVPMGNHGDGARAVGKHILLIVLAVLIVLGLASAGLLVWLVSGAGVNRFEEGKGRAVEDTGVYLIMFRDTRAGQNTAVLGSGAGMEGDAGRTDAMMLVRVNDTHGVDMITIPRDILVDIPACERTDGTMSGATHDKINAAYAYGAVGDDPAKASSYGAGCAEQAVEGLTDVPIEGVAVLDAAVVPVIVDALGGVEVCVDGNRAAELESIPVGCNVLGGSQVFEYAQKREGIEDSSDLARNERQRAVLQAVMDKLGQLGPADAPKIVGLIRDIAPYVTADEGMTSAGFATDALRAVQAGGYRGRQMPVDETGDGNSLHPAPEAGFLWRALRDGQPLPTV